MKRAHRQFFRVAMEMSKRSNHSKHAHGSVTVQRNSIVSRGANVGLIHAEVATLRSCPILKDARRVGLTVFVCRVNNQGEFRNSKPCCKCQKFMKKWGISKVYYTQDDGGIGFMRID